MSCNQRNLNILDKYPPHLHIAEMDEITWSSGMRMTRQQKRKMARIKVVEFIVLLKFRLPEILHMTQSLFKTWFDGHFN